MATTTGAQSVVIQVGTATPNATGGQTVSWATYWSGTGTLRHSKRVTWRQGGAGEIMAAPYLLVFAATDAPSIPNNWDLYRALVAGVYYNVSEAAEYDNTVQLWMEVQR